jgi:hypothetical protein
LSDEGDDQRILLPTLSEFIDKARRQYSVRLIHLQREESSVVEAGFLVRITSSGERLRAPLPNLPADQPLAAHTLSRLCRALRLPTHEFGLLFG